MPKKNIDELPVLSQNDLLSDKILVPASDNRKTEGLRPAAFKIYDAIQAAIAKFLLDRDIIPFVEISGNIWDVADTPRIIIDLETDANAYVTKNTTNGRLFEAYVKQPMKGGQSFYIDDQRVKINRTGNTLVIGRYIGNQLDLHTDANASANKPILISQSKPQTVLAGQIVSIQALFDDGNEFAVYKNTRRVEGSSGSGLTFYADEPASYEFEAINEFGKTRSLPIPVKIGEPEAPRIITQPVSSNVAAGGSVLLNPDVTGVPTPDVFLQKQTGVDSDNKPVYTDVVQVPDGGYTLAVEDTATYRYRLTNRVPNEEAVNSYSDAFTITADKQPQTAPSVVMDDATEQSTLYHVLASGETLAMFEGTLNADSSFPDLKPLTLVDNKVILTVGDIDLAVGKAGIRRKSTKLLNPSPWATNQQAYTGSIQPFTAFVPSPENSWTLDGNKATTNVGLGADGASLPSSIQLPKVAGSALRAVMTYQGDLCPMIVLDASSSPQTPLADQDFGVYGYQGKAAVVANNSVINDSTPMVNGDMAVLRIDDNLKLMIDIVPASGNITSFGPYNYPDGGLFIKGYSTTGGASMVVTTKGV